MFRIYTVKSGDTIESIAESIGINSNFLRAINGLNDNYIIQEGTQIIVPFKEEGNFDKYIVQKGDTIYEIARKYDVDVKDLLMLNGLEQEDYIYPNQEILVPSQNLGIYITREGDSIQNVEKKLNISFENLRRKNQQIYLVPEQLIVYEKNL